MGRASMAVRERILSFMRDVGRPVSAGEVLSYAMSGRPPAAVVRETLDALESEGLASCEVIPSAGRNGFSRIYTLNVAPRPSRPGASCYRERPEIEIRARPAGPCSLEPE